VDGPNLLIKIESLQLVDVGLAFTFRIAIETVDGDLLSSGELLLRDGLARDSVKNVAALTSKTLEVIGDVGCREVGGCKSSVRLCLLLLPPWVEEFNCKQC
jgi:hypothetical protein